MERFSRRFLRNLTHGAALLAFAALTAANGADRHQPTPGVPPKAEQKGVRNGVVAVSHPLAAEAGAKILREGGNAIDAAAAIAFALNVVEPQSSGIGGGGFMMIHLARSGKTFVIDSRERAPQIATPDMFQGLSFLDASTSGISVGVPGTVRGVATALDHWGTMSLGKVLAPAIKLARDGFRINPVLAADIVSTRNGVVMTTLQPETAAIFQPGGKPLKAGDRLVQRDLARTLRLLARHGPDVFYEGEIAHAILDAQLRTRAGGAGVGRMTLADLVSYEAKIRQPIVVNYRGFTVASMSPPSSGALTIGQMLKMLERFRLGDTSLGFGFGAQNTLHVMIEAMRLAFADRAMWMGDNDFVHVPTVGLLAAPYVQSRSAQINLNSRITPDPTAGNPLPFDKPSIPRAVQRAALGQLEEEGVNTTHFSVVDRHGNIVSYTTTIESVWGTGITVPGYGFLLNNELTDFNFTPRLNPAAGDPGANDVAPFKRPRSSMSPTILLKHGRPFAAYGSPGGATIINSVFQITLNLIDHGMSIQEAIDAPRISVGSPAGTVSCEAGPLVPLLFTPTPPLSSTVLDALRALGHNIPPCSTTPIGSVQSVIVDLRTGKQFGGADPRREGTVIGLPRRHDRHEDEDDD